MATIEARLKELGIALPEAAAPVGSYVPFVVSGNLIFVSGQITLKDGTPQYIGKLGDTIPVADGYQAARLCGLNLLAQAKAACGGNLDAIMRVVKLSGFVNCTPDFMDHPKVINGASDLMVEVFGDRGRHARAAVGAPSLPLGVATEVEAVFEAKF